MFRYNCADQQLELGIIDKGPKFKPCIADRRLKLGIVDPESRLRLNVANTQYQYEVERYSCHCNPSCLYWGGCGYGQQLAFRSFGSNWSSFGSCTLRIHLRTHGSNLVAFRVRVG